MAYIFGSIWDRFNRNALNDLSISVEQQGKSIQDLVAEGQLTPTQYAQLIQTVNGLISKGDVSVEDIDKSLGKLDATFFTNSFLEQLNDGVINATKVLPQSITSGDLAKGAVTPETTSFFDINQTKNLFDPNDIRKNTSIDLSGNIITEENRWLSDYIPVSNSDFISLTNGSYRIGVYKQDKVFVSRNGVTNDSVFEIPPFYGEGSIGYIRISGTNDPESIMVNYGNTLLPFESGVKNPKVSKEYLEPLSKSDIEDGMISYEKTDFIKLQGSKQLFDINKMTPNTSIDFEGNFVSDNTWWLSDFIPYTRESLKIAANTQGSNVRLFLYGADKSFRSRTGFNESYEFTFANVPQENETRFFRISGTYSSHPLSTFMLNYGDSVLPYEDFESPQVSLDTDLLKYPEEKIESKHLSLNLRNQISRPESPFPKKLDFEEIHTGYYKVSHLSKDGKVVYFIRGFNVAQSLDDGDTIQDIFHIPDVPSIQAIRDTDDGELLISTTRNEDENIKSRVYKTIGYDRQNLENTQYKMVLESVNSQANFYDVWGLEAHHNICLASEYGLRGDNGARHVYLSEDFGETWNLIFDQKETTKLIEGAPTWTQSAHLHTVHYDRYDERIWLVVGDSPNTATYYSDNLGSTWKYVPNSNIVQYTGIVSFPDGVVFGSDRYPNGLYVWKRTLDKSEEVVIEPLKLIDNESKITRVFQRGFRRYNQKNELTLFSATRVADYNGVYRSIIMGLTDIDNPYILYELPHDFLGIHNAVGSTENGFILASYANGQDTSIIRAKAPMWE